MGQVRESKRNATLDDRKRRAAGREQNKPGVAAVRNWTEPEKNSKATGGAHGRGGKANRVAAVRGAGGGTGFQGGALDVKRSSRPARKKSSAR